MKIICAWCSLDMGSKAPYNRSDTSHGMCRECSEKMLKEMDNVLNGKEISEDKMFQRFLEIV